MAPAMRNPDASCRESGSTVAIEDEDAPEASCDRQGANVSCVGDWAVRCDADRRVVDRTNCRVSEQVCAERRCDDARDCEGCVACKPLRVRCGPDGERERCRQDGSGYDPEQPCDPSAGLYCDAIGGECTDLCEQARATRSYIGCEYYAVSTSNEQLAFAGFDDDGACQPFSFAIVVANGTDVPADVTIETAGGEVIERTVAPGKTQAIDLPCSLELTGQVDPEDLPDTLGERFSTAAVRGAHHITSNVPVTVYQFNPLEFESQIGGAAINSYTNDASLLLPVSALTGNYMAITVPTLLHEIEADELDEPARVAGPGFVTIVGVSEQPAEIEIISSAHTLPSADGALPALEPGESFMITLARGEVAQILSDAPEGCAGDESDDRGNTTRHYCKVPRDFDLTGTRIRANKPVMVLSGHDCAFIPFNRWACDHLEEVMQPLEAWGQDVVVSVTDQASCDESLPNLVRVVASHDDTNVRFEPAVHERITLDEGEVLETELSDDVHVFGDKPIAVAQLLPGEEYEGLGESSSFTKGDPSLSLAIPSEQWRKRYSILSPETFTDNFVGVIAHPDQVVLLDGRVITRFQTREGATFKSAQVRIRGGQHTLESEMPFGVTVYGFASFTSYMVAGGLDLTLINPPD